MGVITRGIKNTFRNKTRTMSFSVIIAISLGLAFSMLLANKAVNESNRKLRDDVGASLLIFPQGALNGEATFTNADADKLAKLPSVKQVIKTTAIVAQHAEEVEKNKQIDKKNSEKKNKSLEISSSNDGAALPNTSLRSAIDEQALSKMPNPLQMTPTIPGVSIEGSTANIDAQGNKIKPIEGKLLDMNKLDEVLVGKPLAEKNNLKIGGTFTVKNKTLKVVGIFDTGAIFENNRVIAPFDTVYALNDSKAKMPSLLVAAQSLESLDITKKDILKAMNDSIDVQPMQQEAVQVAAGLNSIANISFITLIVALIAAGFIILLTMLLVVRERTKEIGTLKAIGATNFKIVCQFMVEAVVLNIIGAVFGLVMAALASNMLLGTLIAGNVRSEESTMPGVSSLVPEQPVHAAQQLAHNITTFVDWQFIAFGLIVSLSIALIATLIPAFLVAKVRPAQIMRGDS